MTITYRERLDQILNIPSTTPDNQRRGRILNSLLLILVMASILAIPALLLGWATGNLPTNELLGFIRIIVIFLVGNLLTYAINRYWSSTIAVILFLVQFIGIIFISDDLPQLLTGRSTILFVFPILMSSILLRSYASFGAAALLSIISIIVGQRAKIEISFVIYITYFIIALLPWYASRNLEQAIARLQNVNRELDQRVALRTTELQQTNWELKEQIIERQRANNALQIAHNQSLAANRLKSELLARVSHELRTPLGAILGFAEMLRAGVLGDLTSEQMNALSQIIENNHDLTVLVNDLLDQARLEAGKLQLNMAPFAVHDLVQHVYTNLNVLAHKKGLTLITKIERDVPSMLIGDVDRLNQILVNLVGNGIKYTRTGTITLRILRSNDAYWAMQVADSGPGIPQEAHEHIFEAFRQLDGSLTRRDEGVGLGLSIVKQLTALMKGHVTLESVVGEGSCFTVMLPILESKL